MALVLDLSRRNAWSSGVQGGPSTRVRDVPDTPPGMSGTSILCECMDGDNAPWNDVPGQTRAEVAQVQSGACYPIGRDSWTVWWARFNSVAPFDGLDWHFYIESHLPRSGTSASWGGNVQGMTHMLRRTPHGWAHTWPRETYTPITLGRWVQVCHGWRPSQGTDGWMEWWIDGTRVYRQTGIKTSEDNASSYLKIGWYRPYGVTGADSVNIFGCQVHDTLPALVQPGGQVPAPSPPPVTRVTMLEPAAGATVASPARVRATVENLPAGGVTYVGAAAGESRQFPAAADVDVELPVATGRQWLYVAVHNAAGGKVAEAAVPVNVEDVPPPPPPPVVDVAAVRAELAAARAALNRADDLLP